MSPLLPSLIKGNPHLNSVLNEQMQSVDNVAVIKLARSTWPALPGHWDRHSYMGGSVSKRPLRTFHTCRPELIFMYRYIKILDLNRPKNAAWFYKLHELRSLFSMVINFSNRVLALYLTETSNTIEAPIFFICGLRSPIAGDNFSVGLSTDIKWFSIPNHFDLVFWIF